MGAMQLITKFLFSEQAVATAKSYGISSGAVRDRVGHRVSTHAMRKYKYQLGRGRQRLMKFPPDLVPQKVIASDLCVSLVTLWRARRSGIPGFPEPVVLRNMVFWRKGDVDRLEDALLKFEGRGKFEEQRVRARRNDRLMRARPMPKKRKRSLQRDETQLDLL